MTDARRDVVFLVADKAMKQMLIGFLGREKFHRSLRCSHFDFEPEEDTIVATRRDSEVYGKARELLRPYERSHRRAVVMVNNAWNGSPGAKRIHQDIAETLDGVWEQYAVVVLDPELEAWVWQDNPHVAEAFRGPSDFRRILAESGHWPDGVAKPEDPKAALDHLRRHYRADPSDAAFRRLAAKISVKHCQDAAFNSLCGHLRTWFPEHTS